MGREGSGVTGDQLRRSRYWAVISVPHPQNPPNASSEAVFQIRGDLSLHDIFGVF